jgi:hypothetical protein
MGIHKGECFERPATSTCFQHPATSTYFERTATSTCFQHPATSTCFQHPAESTSWSWTVVGVKPPSCTHRQRHIQTPTRTHSCAHHITYRPNNRHKHTYESSTQIILTHMRVRIHTGRQQSTGAQTRNHHELVDGRLHGSHK